MLKLSKSANFPLPGNLRNYSKVTQESMSLTSIIALCRVKVDFGVVTIIVRLSSSGILFYLDNGSFSSIIYIFYICL